MSQQGLAWSFQYIDDGEESEILGVMPIHVEDGKRLVACVICGKKHRIEQAWDTQAFNDDEKSVIIFYPFCSKVCMDKFTAASHDTAWMYRNLFQAAAQALRSLYDLRKVEEAK